MNKNIIYLAGFMGAGKSTIGPILANTIGWEFCDLDKFIEESIGKTIREIFEHDGEEFFRKRESELLLDLSMKERIVISLGGGTMLNDVNLRVIKNTGITIYLKASTDSFYKRLRFKRDRPVLGITGNEDFSKDKLMLKIDQLVKKREGYYEQADITVITDNSSIGKTVDKIVNLLSKMNIGKANENN